ncbi:unnamed protein product [Phaedon cochleariae]|uniref:Uncharacterized protein n=1 Tax=Phaedon cochleariae TaxID=80249 RepID=A0A9P0DSB0_PHACE|nr:unnamed protein product [Phaedon cochleariae]
MSDRKDQEEKEESSTFLQETDSKCSSSTSITNKEDTEVFERQLTKTEVKKPKTSIKLPGQLDITSKEETQVVGDDVTKRNEQNIICECQPNVAGAAVPTLSSVNSLANSLEASDEFLRSQYVSGNESEKLLVHDSLEVPSTSIAKSDNKASKKPSMIPIKLTRPNSSNRPVRDRGQTDLLKKTVKEQQLHTNKKNETKFPKDKPYRSKIEGKNIVGHLEDRPTSKISSRMLNLQERLKATTSMLRKRFEDDKSKADSSCQISSGCCLTNQESVSSQTSEEETSPTSVVDLYKIIIQLKETATKLSSISILGKQKGYIEKLLLKITEIQKIADHLSKCENSNEKFVDGNEERKTEISKSAKTKDNKIYIKFVPKKKHLDSPKDNTEVTQTELDLGTPTSECRMTSEVNIPDETNHEISMKDSDSMDGIFIPSCEPPINIEEEEEETNGLDITITFPEINNLLSHEDHSHLSVRLSDISEEALKKLKRCPKDFTLRMDFVQGKILFQTGKAPVNNFSIGPDLKFVENPIDEKKSDIISIKPSTECSFASQLIPVENITKEITSYKSLRSTDSELFSVVNLPYIYRNSSLNTVTKSCITFKNDGILSMALLARHFGRSMPQIPSITNIFEEKIMENLNKATDIVSALQIQERRRKNRANQRRAIITPNNV